MEGTDGDYGGRGKGVEKTGEENAESGEISGFSKQEV
jgi:hypothetical protein